MELRIKTAFIREGPTLCAVVLRRALHPSISDVSQTLTPHQARHINVATMHDLVDSGLLARYAGRCSSRRGCCSRTEKPSRITYTIHNLASRFTARLLVLVTKRRA